jgi:hypothetical protein
MTSARADGEDEQQPRPGAGPGHERRTDRLGDWRKLFLGYELDRPHGRVDTLDSHPPARNEPDSVHLGGQAHDSLRGQDLARSGGATQP